VLVLPKLPRDAGDRNRTSPFDFTGNKFEFRAVSANQSIAFPNIALNVAVTESLDFIATQLETAIAGGSTLERAAGNLLVEVVKDNKQIIFNGNNYAEEWQQEAEQRGLLNRRNTVDALPEMMTPAVVQAFEKYKVLNERELHARFEVNHEAYSKTINIEAQLMVLMANRYIMPAALAYQTQVAQNVAALKAAGASTFAGTKLLETLSSLIDEFRARTDELTSALDHTGSGSAEQHARCFRDVVIPKMAELRETGDKIELFIPSDEWPLPTYREMLFIK